MEDSTWPAVAPGWFCFLSLQSSLCVGSESHESLLAVPVTLRRRLSPWWLHGPRSLLGLLATEHIPGSRMEEGEKRKKLLKLYLKET